MGSPAPTLLEMISRLVATPSMSSVNPSFDTGNRAVIDLLAGWLADLGFAVEVMPLPQWPDKANLIATLGTGPGGLVLAGHTDTVPYDDGRWDHDPFILTEQDGRLYGLGTSDMKAFLAMAVEAGRGLRPEQLSAPLIILATAGFFVPLKVDHPVWMILFLVFTAVTFSLLGFIIGIWADGFEKLQLVPLLIITPLTFLGGTFYSIKMLPPFWQTVTLFNPVVYLISGFRWSFYGISDVNIKASLGATLLFLGLCLAIVWWIFKTGYRLKA